MSRRSNQVRLPPPRPEVRLPLSEEEISLRGCLGSCRAFYHHKKFLLCSQLSPGSLLSGLVVVAEAAVGLDTCQRRPSVSGEQREDGDERWSLPRLLGWDGMRRIHGLTRLSHRLYIKAPQSLPGCWLNYYYYYTHLINHNVFLEVVTGIVVFYHTDECSGVHFLISLA